MKASPSDDLSSLSMLELFHLEAESQAGLLTAGLLELERSPAPGAFEPLMRAAHSFKGAARIVNLHLAVRVAHAMEDCFVAAQHGRLQLGKPEIDLLLRGVDLLSSLSRTAVPDGAPPEEGFSVEVEGFLSTLSALAATAVDQGQNAAAPVIPPAAPAPGADLAQPASSGATTAFFKRDAGDTDTKWLAVESPGHLEPSAAIEPLAHTAGIGRPESAERVLRLTADNLNRLLALASESLAESRWLRPFAGSLQHLKRQHQDLEHQLGMLRQQSRQALLTDAAANCVAELSRNLSETQQILAERIQELDLFDRRSAQLSQRLYLEVLRTRMRPFSDGIRRFPRMIRDLARQLGKEVRFEVRGETTQVDRDILERLETPLAHLLRNAIDHGCESPEDRQAAGKSRECVISLEARHRAGVLIVTVSDDGQGVDLERVRAAVLRKELCPADRVDKLGEPELLEFLFIPGFTVRESVTEISGRGYGLDVVQNMVRSVRGVMRLNNRRGRGLKVQLQLPLTLSVVRALLVEIQGEAYAIPLSQMQRALSLPRTNVESLEGRQYFRMGNQQVSLLAAHRMLECDQPALPRAELPVVIIGDRTTRHGLVVDRLLGERELVVQPLDPRLGRIPIISAAALMEDGSPVLILDVDDMLRTIGRLASGGRLNELEYDGLNRATPRAKRVLAVDDSITVRELQRKLLSSRGYETEVAVDGFDAWNAVRSKPFDLVITDVDMPRLDGVGLAALIKKDPLLKSMPVMILSYKDSEEDRVRGLEAGADYYLTKGNFHDDTLVQAVVDLIGEAAA